MTLEPEEMNDAYEFVTENMGRNARFETFSERLPPTYERLVEVATKSEVITYGELAGDVGTDKRQYLSKILDGVGYIQKQRNEPPLTVLVVQAGNRLPADGFFELVDILGLREEYTSTTDEALLDEITTEVHDYYG